MAHRLHLVFHGASVLIQHSCHKLENVCYGVVFLSLTVALHEADEGARCAGGMLDIGRSMALVPPRLEQPTAEALAPAPVKVAFFFLFS